MYIRCIYIYIYISCIHIWFYRDTFRPLYINTNIHFHTEMNFRQIYNISTEIHLDKYHFIRHRHTLIQIYISTSYISDTVLFSVQFIQYNGYMHIWIVSRARWLSYNSRVIVLCVYIMLYSHFQKPLKRKTKT